MNKLTNGLKFPRNSDFTYAKILEEKQFLTEFMNWLKFIDTSCFDFEPIAIYDISIDLKNYMEYNKWLLQIEALKNILNKRLNKVKIKM